MLGKYSISLLLASAAADKYQLSVDGPCGDEPAFEKILPLLMSTHAPLEGKAGFDAADQYSGSCSAGWKDMPQASSSAPSLDDLKAAGSTKFTINTVHSHPLVTANSDSGDKPRVIFPPQDEWINLTAV
jgi:hypothetical protein